MTPYNTSNAATSTASPSKRRYVPDSRDIEVVKKIKQNEVELRDRNSVLRGIKPNVSLAFSAFSKFLISLLEFLQHPPSVFRQAEEAERRQSVWRFIHHHPRYEISGPQASKQLPDYHDFVFPHSSHYYAQRQTISPRIDVSRSSGPGHWLISKIVLSLHKMLGNGLRRKETLVLRI